MKSAMIHVGCGGVIKEDPNKVYEYIDEDTPEHHFSFHFALRCTKCQKEILGNSEIWLPSDEVQELKMFDRKAIAEILMMGKTILVLCCNKNCADYVLEQCMTSRPLPELTRQIRPMFRVTHTSGGFVQVYQHKFNDFQQVRGLKFHGVITCGHMPLRPEFTSLLLTNQERKTK